MNAPRPTPELLGWREWISIPALHIPRIKAKIDTGARSSCLHTTTLETYTDDAGQPRVRFTVHPLVRRTTSRAVHCDCPLASSRVVRDSGGHEELRPFIHVPVTLGPHTWEVEFSLTNRDNMKFRMLLGRTAMKDRFIVDPTRSYLFGKRKTC